MLRYVFVNRLISPENEVQAKMMSVQVIAAKPECEFGCVHLTAHLII